MDDRVKLRVTFSYKLVNNIRITIYVRNLKTEDPAHYRRLALVELLKLGYTRVILTTIEIME